MATQNSLIMNLLRLMTPEEIGEVATQHNGGKFLSLTDLVLERVEHKIYRDFSGVDSMNEIHESHAQNNQAKILPFKTSASTGEEEITNGENDVSSDTQNPPIKLLPEKDLKSEHLEHKENENMSAFILIEKARIKRSQYSLKHKEIIDLYQKNSDVDVEQIKESNINPAHAKEAGVLINKKQY